MYFGTAQGNQSFGVEKLSPSYSGDKMEAENVYVVILNNITSLKTWFFTYNTATKIIYQSLQRKIQGNLNLQGQAVQNTLS